MILTATFGSATTASLPLAALQLLLVEAERAGFDAALFVRSPGVAAPMQDAVPLVAALASVPATIGLGASVPIDFSEPFHLARSFAAIDRLTHGRSAVVLDIAAGDDLAPAIGASAFEDERAARRAEFLDVATALWDSWEDAALLVDRPRGLFTDPDRIHRINHDGRHFAVRGPLNAPRPLQGWPVIVVPVRCAASHELAARWADVALIGRSTPEIARRTGAALREQAVAFGRDAQAIRVLVDIEPCRMDAHQMCRWHANGVCDGFNLIMSGPPPALAMEGPVVADGTTLRDRLGLARPRNRYAA